VAAVALTGMRAASPKPKARGLAAVTASLARVQFVSREARARLGQRRLPEDYGVATGE